MTDPKDDREHGIYVDTPENRARAAHQGTLDHMDGVVARRVELEDSKRVLEATLWAVRGILKTRSELGPMTESQLIRAEAAIRELIDDVLGPYEPPSGLL